MGNYFIIAVINLVSLPYSSVNCINSEIVSG